MPRHPEPCRVEAVDLVRPAVRRRVDASTSLEPVADVLRARHLAPPSLREARLRHPAPRHFRARCELVSRRRSSSTGGQKPHGHRAFGGANASPGG